MSIIRRLPSGPTVILSGYVRFGRDGVCELQQADPWVSNTHATLSWTAPHWWLQDKLSRNGTFLNGTRLPPDGKAVVKGDRISLGNKDDGWEMVASGPPLGYATNLETGQQVLEKGGTLALPPDAPEVFVYHDEETHSWFLEGRRVKSGQVVNARGEWRISVPIEVMKTQDGQSGILVAKATVRFQVSRSMDQVGVELRQGDQVLSMEPRVPWWPIWLLARERRSDTTGPEHDRGWMDMEELEKQSGLERRTIDIYIGRAKDYLEAKGVIDSEKIVEVRRGQRRIGVPFDRILPDHQ